MRGMGVPADKSDAIPGIDRCTAATAPCDIARMETPSRLRGSGHRALRKGRTSEPFRIYLLTTTTAARTPIFADPHAARSACRCFDHPVLLRDARMLAWVLMPDHAHWLVQLGDSQSLHRLVHALKTFSARNANRTLGRTGPLWARGFHDRALRADEDLPTVVHDVLANPVRAGLVRDATEYPFSRRCPP